MAKRAQSMKSRRKVSRRKVSRRRSMRGGARRTRGGASSYDAKSGLAKSVDPALAASAAKISTDAALATAISRNTAVKTALVSGAYAAAAANDYLVKDAQSASSGANMPFKGASASTIASAGTFYPIGGYKFVGSTFPSPPAAKGTILVYNTTALKTNWKTFFDGTANETVISVPVASMSDEGNNVAQMLVDIANAKGAKAMVTDGNNAELNAPCFYFKFTNAARTSEIILRNAYARILPAGADKPNFVILARRNLAPTSTIRVNEIDVPHMHSYSGTPQPNDVYTLSVAVVPGAFKPPSDAP